MENKEWEYLGNFAVIVAYPGDGNKVPDVISDKHGMLLKAYRHNETREVKFYDEEKQD